MRTTSRSSAANEFRRRMADPMAALKRGRSASAIRSRARNCTITRLMRRWTTSSARMRSGSARRNRACTSTLRRKGTSTSPHHARPSHVESSSSGSHVISTPARMRRWTSVRASSERCARRSSWYSGPPSTREKSAGSSASGSGGRIHLSRPDLIQRRLLVPLRRHQQVIEVVTGGPRGCLGGMPREQGAGRARTGGRKCLGNRPRFWGLRVRDGTS